MGWGVGWGSGMGDQQKTIKPPWLFCLQQNLSNLPVWLKLLKRHVVPWLFHGLDLRYAISKA